MKPLSSEQRFSGIHSVKNDVAAEFQQKFWQHFILSSFLHYNFLIYITHNSVQTIL